MAISTDSNMVAGSFLLNSQFHLQYAAKYLRLLGSCVPFSQTLMCAFLFLCASCVSCHLWNMRVAVPAFHCLVFLPARKMLVSQYISCLAWNRVWDVGGKWYEAVFWEPTMSMSPGAIKNSSIWHGPRKEPDLRYQPSWESLSYTRCLNCHVCSEVWHTPG